jgi:arsenate reductase-like glutaredoxin family protein
LNKTNTAIKQCKNNKREIKMKLVKTASGKKQIKMSKKEWQNIGKKAGWMKKAEIESTGSIKSDLKSMNKSFDIFSYFKNEVSAEELQDFISTVEKAEQYIEITMRNKAVLGLAKTALNFKRKEGEESLDEQMQGLDQPTFEQD